MAADTRITIARGVDPARAYAIGQALPGSFTPEGLDALQADVGHQIAYGAYGGQELLGFATFDALNDDALELTWLAVLPQYHGKGIGTRLVGESLREIGHAYTICEVKTLAETHPDPGYARTRMFYRRLGFIPLEIIQPYPGWQADNPCQIFVKCLAGSSRSG